MHWWSPRSKLCGQPSAGGNRWVTGVPSRNICLDALLSMPGLPLLFRDCWLCLLEISIGRADLFRWTDRHLCVLLLGLAAFQFLLCKRIFFNLFIGLLAVASNLLFSSGSFSPRQVFSRACSLHLHRRVVPAPAVREDHRVAFAVTLLSWLGVLGPVLRGCACVTAWGDLLQPQGWLCWIRVTPWDPSWPEVCLICRDEDSAAVQDSLYRTMYIKEVVHIFIPLPLLPFWETPLALTACL